MSRNITFPAGDLLLEGVLHSPTAGQIHAAAIMPCPAAVVCHPHPLYGGDMQNSVVVAICDALAVDGMAALRFNFRGVGASDGSYGGKDERRDVRAAVDFLASQPEIDPRRLCLAGYSFGALVALSAGDERVRALAAISPPLSPPSFASPSLRCPALFVFGERDTISPADALATSGIELPEGSRVAVIRDADHFWRGQEKAVAAAVVGFFREVTGPGNGRTTN